MPRARPPPEGRIGPEDPDHVQGQDGERRRHGVSPCGRRRRDIGQTSRARGLTARPPEYAAREQQRQRRTDLVNVAKAAAEGFLRSVGSQPANMTKTRGDRGDRKPLAFAPLAVRARPHEARTSADMLCIQES